MSLKKASHSHTAKHRNVDTVSQYVRILTHNYVAIIGVTVLAAIIGYFTASNIVPVYRSNVDLMLVGDEQESVTIADGISLSKGNSIVESQIQLLRSRSIAEEVVSNLRLADHRDFIPQKKGAFSTWLNEMFGFSAVNQVNRLEKPKGADAVSFAVRAFEQRMYLNNSRGSSLVRISFDSSDRYLAPKVADEIVKVYQKRLSEIKSQGVENSVGWLSSRLENVRKKLVGSEANLRSYQDSANLVDSSEEKRIRSDKISGITSQIVRSRAHRADVEALYDQVKKIQKTKGKAAAVSILNDEKLNDLNSRERDIMFQIKRMSERYGEKHPKMVELRSSHKIIKKQVETLIDSIIHRVKKELDLAIANEREAERLFSQIQTELSKGKQKQFDLAKLEMEVSTNRELYDMLLVRLKELDINKSENIGSVRVLDSASVPTGPIKPNKMQIILFACLLGFGVSVAFAIYREISDPTFKTGEELMDRFDLPLLGVIPMMSRRLNKKYSAERISAHHPRSTVAEAFNNVRTNIIMSNGERPPKIILVTSAIASEGKTTVSSNLAIALAALGPTLLLECDTRKPRFKRIVDERPIGGVLEYMSRKNTLKESVAHDHEITNLFTMPVNAMPEKPLELFSSTRFKTVLEDLAKRFHYIVIDSPPILPVSDTVVLSPLCDGVVMVVGAEKTHKKAVFGAVDRLNRVGANVMGTVLSQASIRTMSSYGDHYYYGYDKYDSSPKPA